MSAAPTIRFNSKSGTMATAMTMLMIVGLLISREHNNGERRDYASQDGTLR